MTQSIYQLPASCEDSTPRRNHTMQYSNAIIVALLATMTASVGFSCSSSPDTADDEAIPVEQQRLDAADTFEASAQWLPPKSDVVFSLAGPTMWDSLGYGLLPTTNPDADPGALGTLDGLHSDLGDVLSHYFGFDFGQTYSLVAGVDVDGDRVSLVLLGDFDDPVDAPTVDIGTQSAYELNLGDALSEVFGPQDILYALPIDEPHQGLVLSDRTDDLSSLTDGDGLDVTTEEATFPRLFEDAGGAVLAIAVTGEHMEALLADIAAMGMPVPAAAIVSYGDDLRATIEGEATNLERIVAMVGDYIESFRSETEARYEAGGNTYLDKMEAIYLHHSIAAVADQLQPELDENRLRYEIQLTDEGSRFEVLLASAIPYALFTARTAFETYNRRAKAAEAEGLLSTASMSAPMYCEGRQLYSAEDGAEPWNKADPDDSDRQEGTPVPLEKRVFPGGTDITITTASEVPEGGEQVEFNPQIDGDVDFDPEAVLAALGIQHHGPSYFRYTYETGPGKGKDATAILVAEANFDPSSSRHHTVTVEFNVDDNQACISTPPYTENEGH